MIDQENNPLHELVKHATMLAAVYYYNQDEDSLEQLDATIELIARYGYHIHLEPHGPKAHPQVRIALWPQGAPGHFFQDWREAASENIDDPKAHAIQNILRKMNFSILITNREKKIKTASYTIYSAVARLIYAPEELYEEHAIFIKKLHPLSEEKTDDNSLAGILDPRDMQFLGL